MQFLTDFADEAVVLPLFAVVAIALAVSGWRRGLVAWVLVIGGVLGSMALLKYLFYACYSVLAITGIHSPSGHTAASTAVYGGGMLLLLRGRVPVPVLALVPVAIAVLIGISRVDVHAHVPLESVAGGAVGLVGAALLVLLAGPRPPLRAAPILAACAAALLFLHGAHINAERMIHHFVLFTWLPLPRVCRV